MAVAIIALTNTVTNDVVVATSDAELRISDRGLGLGLEVVGGGAAEVKLEARPGWRFRDGSTSVTLNKAAGKSVKSPNAVGEGQSAEGSAQVVIEDGEDDEDGDDEGSVDHVKPILSLTASAPKVVAYSILDGGTNVSISLSATVTTKGRHRKLDANGNVVEEKEFSPKRYVWKMTGAATGEAETDLSTHTFVASLTKGNDKKLSFSVVGKICGICDGEVESDKATDSVEIDVYELSISRPDYLGLDRTDAGRQGHVVKTATLSSDPSLPSSSSVEWKECGICEFVGAKNQRSVSYQNKDSDTASGEYLAERLAASVRLAGMDSSVVCATNFTVVKVDAQLAGVDELLEETRGPLIPNSYAEIKMESPVASKKKELVITIKPTIPVDNSVKVVPCGVALLPAGNDYVADGFLLRRIFNTKGVKSLSLDVWGNSVDRAANANRVEVMHLDSQRLQDGAKDLVKMTCYGFELVTPAGDPVGAPKSDDGADGQNEFTYNDTKKLDGKKGVLRVWVKARLLPEGVSVGENRIKGKFDVGAIEGSSLTWRKKKGSECNVYADGSVEADQSGTFEAVALFAGYPKENSEFGKKKARFTLSGVVKEADYEVFFEKKGINHPPCELCPNCPNWFYYWKNGGVCDMPEYVYYGGNKSDMYGEAFVGVLSLLKDNPNLDPEVASVIADIADPKRLVALYDLAAEEEEEGKVADVIIGKGKRAKKYPGFKYGGRREGLACCAAIVAHEVHHVDLYNMNADRPDTDKDQMADGFESSMDGIATHVGRRDTYRLSRKNSNYGVYAGYGDNEIRARRVERTKVVYYEEKDWANPGFQSKPKCGYDELKN